MNSKRITLTALILFIGLSCAAYLYPLLWTRVYAGVTVEGVNLGGRSREEVAQILSLWQQQYADKKLKVYYGDSSFDVDAKKIAFSIDVDATLDDVWNYGRKGSWWQRLKNIGTAMHEGYRIPLRIRYNENELNKMVLAWQEKIDRPPRNAALSLLTGGIVPQEQGRKLDDAVVKPLVLKALQKPDTTSIPLPVAVLTPTITTTDIAKNGIKELLGMYSTTFDAKDVNRTANIKLAARKINGHIVQPGQVFSFNEVVGPREKSEGFKEALEIVDGEFVPGVGGGVCQVSSTLYNAVLLSNLAVTERTNHSKPLVYVALGRDATVAYGTLDFKFVNNSDSPIMIMAEIDGNKLNIGIFGHHSLTEKVEIITTDRQVIPPGIVKKQDNELYLGETKLDKEGKPGYEVTTVRVVSRNGHELKREVLAKDRYLPENTIVKVGTKLPPFAELK